MAEADDGLEEHLPQEEGHEEVVLSNVHLGVAASANFGQVGLIIVSILAVPMTCVQACSLITSNKFNSFHFYRVQCCQSSHLLLHWPGVFLHLHRNQSMQTRMGTWMFHADMALLVC